MEKRPNASKHGNFCCADRLRARRRERRQRVDEFLQRRAADGDVYGRHAPPELQAEVPGYGHRALRRQACPRDRLLQFLSGGQLVGTQYPFSDTPRNRHNQIWHFYGSFTDDTFGPFGALAVDHPLTVRAVVKVSRYTAYPSYFIRVVNAHGCPAK